MKKTLMLLLLTFTSSIAFAKRVAPPEIKPLIKNGTEFNFRIEQSDCEPNKVCGMQVFLTSKNIKTGKINWERELYQKLFKTDLETDVQTIFPRALQFKRNQIIITDERGSTYKVTLKGELASPPKSTIYSQLESSPVPVKLAHNMEVKKIMDNVFMVTDKDYRDSNILVVKMKDGTVFLASSPFENLGAETLLAWVIKTLNPQQIVAVNPHFHMDGTGGNEVYQKNGVEVWSSEQTKKLQLELGQAMIGKVASDYDRKELRERILKSKVVTADNIFSSHEGKTFNFSGEKVEVYYPGPAHSPDNVVVYFPNQKLLFGGCMIKPEELGYLGDADVKVWPNSARNLKKFDVQTVVRGHGSWGGPEFIDKTVAVAEKAANAKK